MNTFIYFFNVNMGHLGNFYRLYLKVKKLHNKNKYFEKIIIISKGGNKTCMEDTYLDSVLSLSQLPSWKSQGSSNLSDHPSFLTEDQREFSHGQELGQPEALSRLTLSLDGKPQRTAADLEPLPCRPFPFPNVCRPTYSHLNCSTTFLQEQNSLGTHIFKHLKISFCPEQV